MCLAHCSLGATAFPRGEGVWRDDAQGGRLLFDNPVVIQCYTSEHLIEQLPPVSAQRSWAKCLIPAAERSVLHGWPKSSQPYTPGLSRGKVSVQAGQPMQAGCGIPRCQ